MSEDRKPWYRRLYVVLSILLGVILLAFLPGAGIYHRNSGGQYCTGCHEIFQP